MIRERLSMPRSRGESAGIDANCIATRDIQSVLPFDEISSEPIRRVSRTMM
jgi:hypothetical protein